MSTIETRSIINAELRAEPATDTTAAKITGAAVVYNTLSEPIRTARGTSFRERIMPGAFGDVASADVRGRYNHDLSLGRTKSGTMKLIDDPTSLRYEISPPNTAEANHVVESVKRGDVDGSSFMFKPLKQNWKTENGEAVREVHLANLYDVGPVDDPAYSATAAPGHAATIRSGTVIDEAEIDDAVAKLNAPPASETPLLDACRRRHAKLI